MGIPVAGFSKHLIDLATSPASGRSTSGYDASAEPHTIEAANNDRTAGTARSDTFGALDAFNEREAERGGRGTSSPQPVESSSTANSVRCTRQRHPPAPDPDSTSPWVSVEVARGLLHCGRTKLFQLIRKRKLIRVDSPGTETCVTRASVIAFMTKHTPQPTARPTTVPETPASPTRDPAKLAAELDARRARQKRGSRPSTTAA